MKYHWSIKLTAFVLATVFLVAAAASGLGVGFLVNEGLFTNSVEEVYDGRVLSQVRSFAVDLAHRYASLELGGIPELYLEYYYGDYWLYNTFREDTWFYTISDSKGKTLESNLPENTGSYIITDSNNQVLKAGTMAPDQKLLHLKAYEIEVTDLGYRQLISAEPDVPMVTEQNDVPSVPAPTEATTEPTHPGSVRGTVNVNNLYVYADPTDPGDPIGMLYAGHPVEITTQMEIDGRHWGLAYEGWIDLRYVTLEDAVDTGLAEAHPAQVTEVTEPAYYDPNGYTVTADGIYSDGYWDYEQGVYMNIQYRQGNLKTCVVTLYLTEDALQEEGYWVFLRQLAPYHFSLLWILGISFLLFAGCAVYLCFAAGRKPGSDEVQAKGLSRLPLDLYLGAVFLAEVALLAVTLDSFEHLVYNSYPLAYPFALAALTVCAILAEGALYALIAQCKMKRGFWWRNTIVGRILRFCGRWIFRGLRAARNMLPIVARWVGVILVLALGALLSLLFLSNAWHDFWQFFWGMWVLSFLCLILGVIGYGAWCFGSLLKGAKNMAQGNLDQKIANPYLRGSFRQMANELNNLADGAKIAAEKQMKSERMKTELITNVSHDIKTPLTSIINYVDLLKSAETKEAQEQYLEVLDRQSQALKKLIEDLMDMSKASSGSVTLELTRIDLVEAVNQALGEFADKLDAVALTPVFRHPEDEIAINADGKHLWRILHNLLSNACKYAMPGTRLYLDLTVLEGRAVLAIKNISREELNMDAEALMERFVRGDASRNTEGNGLGLNIAQSLMQLQKGTMDILVDGDLFKVTLTFPLA